MCEGRHGLSFGGTSSHSQFKHVNRFSAGPESLIAAISMAQLFFFWQGWMSAIHQDPIGHEAQAGRFSYFFNAIFSRFMFFLLDQNHYKCVGMIRHKLWKKGGIEGVCWEVRKIWLFCMGLFSRHLRLCKWYNVPFIIASRTCRVNMTSYITSGDCTLAQTNSHL